VRNNAALLWRRILTADPDAIFGAEVSRLMNRNWADRLPQPAYMGAKIQQNFVVPVLRAAALDFSQVAYVNLLKWRTPASSGLARLYALSWNHHTREQLELLAPSRVIAIGSDAGRVFQRHYTAPVYFDFISRAIGNNVGPAGRVALARIVWALRT